MNAKKLAKKLDGREYKTEITKQEELEAKENKLVVVFYRDKDLVSLHGAKTKLKYLHEIKSAKKSQTLIIEAVHHNNSEYSWTYKTSIQHETFAILEDGKKYCRGIVFSMDDLK